MGVLENVEERLVDAESRVAELVKQLEILGSLEQGLRDASGSLMEAGADLGKLATATQSAEKAFENAITAFRQAVLVLQSANPVETAEAIKNSTAQFASIEQQMAAIVSDTGEVNRTLHSELGNAVDGITSEIRGTREAVAAAAKRIEEGTTTAIEQAVGRLSIEHQKQVKEVKLIGLATLLISLAVLGLGVVIFGPH